MVHSIEEEKADLVAASAVEEMNVVADAFEEEKTSPAAEVEEEEVDPASAFEEMKVDPVNTVEEEKEDTVAKMLNASAGTEDGPIRTVPSEMKVDLADDMEEEKVETVSVDEEEQESDDMASIEEEKDDMVSIEEGKVGKVNAVGEEKVGMDAVAISNKDAAPGKAHTHFAGRQPAGSQLPVCITKNGVNHVIERDGVKKEVLSIGLACSECFSGPRLAQLLKPGFEYERRVMMDLLAGNPAAPLSIHTSGGVPAALADFIAALGPHLPWKDRESSDWCLSLQLEGASAVWAGIDLLLQLQLLRGRPHRKLVAVGARSYHGPPSTSLGASCPLFAKHAQVTYPVPVAGEAFDEEELLIAFEQFLDAHGDDVGVLLVEPQWGSSQVGLPWPKDLVKAYVSRAQQRGILVLADEIMCGLGRHGQGTLFLSEAWGLDPDAVTFGKAIGGGVYPLSGAVIKTGASLLGCNGRTVMQSHTFSGSSARALMTGVEVLNTIPLYHDSIKKMGDEMKVIFRHLEKISKGLIYSQGQGLMWGALVSRKGMHADESVRARTVACLKRNLEREGVVPYFVPAGGFMVSPVLDTDVGTLYAIAEAMERALVATVQEVGWVRPACAPAGVEVRATLRLDDEFCASEARRQCSAGLHFARTCTSCAAFVRPELRRRFSEGLIELQSYAQFIETEEDSSLG